MASGLYFWRAVLAKEPHAFAARPALAIDAGGLCPADLAAVNSLALAALEARRRGRQPVVTNASTELRALIDLAGLARPLGLA